MKRTADLFTSIKLKDSRKYLLFSELCALLDAGLSFGAAFQILIDQQKSGKHSDIEEKIYEKVIEGADLWEAIKGTSQFTPLDYGVVRIGEETGELSKSLVFLESFYKKKIEQRRIFLSALSYPIVILTAAILVLFFMLSFIVPMFEQVYSRLGGELPALTQYVIAFSKVLPSILALLGLVCTIFIFLAVFYGKTGWYKKWTSSFLLRTPIFKDIIKKNYQFRFCSLLHLLVASGVPLVKSFSILKEVFVFYPYKKSFNEVISDLYKGNSIYTSMDKFPNLYSYKLRKLIRIGEETNKLSEMLSKQSKEISFDLEHQLKRIGNLLEPILIFFIGFIVAIILIAMYLPMFKLGVNL